MSEKKTDVFDLDGIRMLVELMKENNVSELDLEQGESKLKLRRDAVVSSVASGVMSSVAAEPVAVLAPSVAPVEVVAAPVAPSRPSVSEDSAFIKTIDSPMVGSFYASPSPDAPPFVKVGDVVTPDKTVCIIEAMKVFNDIQAETSGKIVAVLVKSGDPVEYGAPLFKVDTRG